MDKNKNYLSLEKFSEEQGADLFGVADISKIKSEFSLSAKAIAKLDAAISVGATLSSAVLEEIESAPNKIYFHHYRTANAFLDQLAFRVGKFIQKKGFLAFPVPASQILDWQKQNAHLSHKKVGYLAGLGWIGRNNLLVTAEFGSQLRLVTILTNLPLKTDKPTQQNCADCRICIEACPCGAIKENPTDFQHLKCFEKLKEFQKQHLVEQYICGVCVKSCRGRDDKKATKRKEGI